MTEPHEPRRGNPAAILHDLLNDMLQQPAPLPLHQGWANVLGIEPNLEDVMLGLSHVCQLPRRLLTALAENPATAGERSLLVWEAPVGAVLNGCLSLGSTVESVTRQYVSTGTLASLSAISVMLRSTAPNVPTPDQLSGLLSQLNDFELAVTEADDLSQDLRVFILDRIAEIRQALTLIRVRGVDGLQEVMDRATGAALRVTEADRNHPVWKRFGAVLMALALVIQTADSAIAITSFTAQQLGWEAEHD